MNIVLIGYRCTGKTSVGRSVARKLGVSFYDTDDLVERKTGQGIREIVEAGGWESFRRFEKAAIRDLSSKDGIVIALGGGAVADADNVGIFRKRGLFVWLTADAKTIAERMSADEATPGQRPSLTGKGNDCEVGEMLESRLPLYRRTADATVNTTGKSVDQVAEEICRLLAER